MVNRRSKRSRRPRARTARVRRVITRTDTGFKFTPRADPPEFVVAPWWPLTLKMSISDLKEETSLSPKDISEAIENQTGLKGVTFDMRILSIRVWGLAQHSLSMIVYDTLGDHSRWNNVSDSGSPINFSRVGWKFGAVASLQSHSASTQTVLAKIKGSDGAAIAYVQLLLNCNSAKSAYDLFSGCESDPSPCGVKSRLPCLDSMML